MGLEALIKKHEDQLMGLPNVTAIGIGKKSGKDVIKVFVTHKVPEATLQPQEIIPKTLEGYETDVEESGIIIAQSDPSA
ncbi:conserved hypothetical protein [Nitrosococcus halophilus Nc 4]|uniref:Uncharacterized protein n=1 Tax=Nitrosococcus halophilus (strain Nc4) TaxID=472759 RepID=D5C1R6_NITHN|nr:hypothetical protein [Nitrosococcus halophilus]ADE14699.1 conserved hypothetical protein [Nitrosococcus halophilus Nc 4]